MKIAHFADLHYSAKNLNEAERCFGFAVDEAIRRKVDVAIIAGDSTDHCLDAHAPATIALSRQIRRLADHCPVFMLQGTFSHEPLGILRLFEMIGAKHPITVSDTIEMVALEQGKWHVYDGQGTPELVITAIPTINRSEWLKSGTEPDATRKMAALLDSFADTNEKLHAAGIPTVLVSHGTVDGSMNENGLSLVSLDHEYTAGTLFSAGTDAVMLGHIHQHQSWEREFGLRKQVIAYSGSIGRFHYGERDEKCFLVWDLSDGQVGFEKIVTPSCQMIDIVFPGKPDLEELAAVADQCAGAYVRVRYRVDEEYARQIDRNQIKEILGASIDVRIEGEILPVQRQRCAGITRMATADRFAKWCELTSTPIAGLLEKVDMLSQAPAEAVAGAIIRKEGNDIPCEAECDFLI